MGQTWPRELSGDATFEVFVSPYVEETLQVAAIAAHELCHVALRCRYGHGREFRRVALALGLHGPMRATTATTQLEATFKRLVDEVLGPYPHARLDEPASTDVTVGNQKRQKGRLLKVTCPSCFYAIWTTRTWLARGVPRCPCGVEMRAC